ncbi:c-type cytochrome [Cupriavidus taiwanensis]|uniref:Cytochrome subunit of sulfide dehydrogenase, Flavocytochrome c cytochrome subunit, putative soxE homolog (Modular protein) n=1 Tax=Cupriavidus taiwanensis TaxID=164546 RepID=A0A375IJE2_9BURK|nr:c-type cytochrome [Cupriavidus taiwanensis]SOY52647.1 Cytochrome subunit of sulfide dehydrogenase, Flavocytochrome c cytochrome subunit, putative soxE homolog (modular protein) [Cupriavidus taiwanensis]SOY52808.1 Cytochrome subunit of sulfide dehydrogenase, Flavocytochrome c cytochrome subunit, putative soxE homolog (modular protein) [Cupriavidus taiwanensis]SOY85678.1 Cytochrome subunit of sulfide dehydrogenase, Flavocytochrome c cytochrome subunit, putative soxE homolog (modular protein) [C
MTTTIPRPAWRVPPRSAPQWALLAAMLFAQPALSAGPGGAPAQATDAALRARSQAAACTSCHGPAGRAPAGSTIPSLAGRPQAELAAQMQAFKAGTRPATVMHQLAKGYSDDQIAAIAAWFAAVR